MNIPDDKFPVFEKIMNGETPALLCCYRGRQSVTSVDRICCLCSAELAMAAESEKKEKEMGMVTICEACTAAIASLKPLDVCALFGGKLVTLEDGIRQAEAYTRRN